MRAPIVGALVPDGALFLLTDSATGRVLTLVAKR